MTESGGSVLVKVAAGTGHTACQRLACHCTTPTPPMWIDDDWLELAREVRVATVIRHDGRWARLYNGARSICTAFAHDEPGDHSHLPPISGRAKSRIPRILSPRRPPLRSPSVTPTRSYTARLTGP